MADDVNENKNKVVEEAENYTPAQEASASFATEYLQDLFTKARQGQDKPGDNGKPNESGTIDGAVDDPFKFNQGQTKDSGAKPGENAGNDAASNLQKLFEQVKDQPPGDLVKQNENFQDGNGVLRVLQIGDKQSAQYVAPDGKVTTRLDDKNSIEYDPKEKKYTKVDSEGKRTELDPKSPEKIGPNGETLDQLITGGVSRERDLQAHAVRSTFLDGTVKTRFDQTGVERTTYPPGNRDDGLRQEDVVREKPPADSPETSGRTVRTYEDRKETEFTSEKCPVSKITAFKNPEDGKPAVVTDYRPNMGPPADDSENSPRASRVETYKNNGDENAVKEVAQYRNPDGSVVRPDKVTYNNGKVEDAAPDKYSYHQQDRAPNGDIRVPVGQGEKTGILDINEKTGMPSHMKIGDNDYKVEYGEDGKVKNLTVEAPGDPPSKLELERDPQTGELKVKSADGKFKPDENGKINLEGLPIEVKDGKVVGDLHLNKQGDLRYKTGDGPERHEIVRRANGNVEDYDFKNWKRTTTSPDGQKSEQAWDGFEWRNFKASEDGKRLTFDPPDPKKPAFIERNTSGDPPSDQTTIGYGDGSKLNCDWKNGTQTEVSADGKTETVRHYDGSSYREGKVEEDPSKILDPRTQKPIADASKGDKVVKFENGEPKYAVMRKDGSTVAVHSDNTVVEKNKAGQVTEVNGPKGVFKYQHDGDGDINQVTEYEPDGKTVKNTYTRKGQEKDPGMQQWFGRDGNVDARSPGDAPPRDPANPKAYNTWEVKDKDGNVVEKNLNIHTTADGTMRMEKPAQDGKPAEIEFRPPGGDSYRDTATHRIIDRPGNVTETIDKQTNEKTLEFERNGVKQKISSKDGPCDVLPDGTVRQANKELTEQIAILPDGTSIKSKLEPTPASQENPNGGIKETVQEINIAKNDPAKPGEVTKLKAGEPPVKSIEREGNSSSRFKVVSENQGKEVTSTYDLKAKTRADRIAGENYAKVSTFDGKFKGIVSADGKALLSMDESGNAYIGNGVKLDPKDWKLNDIQTDKDGNAIIKSNKEGSSDQIVLKPNGAVYEKINGVDKATFPNGSEAVFDGDGKVKSLKIGGKEYEPELNADGKVTGLKPKNPADKPIKTVPEGMAYENKLNESGAFFADSSDQKTGVSTHTEWGGDAPDSYSQEKKWKTQDGKDAMMSYVADKDGNISKLALPPDRKSFDVAAAKAGMPELEVKLDNGSVKVKIDANHSLVVNPDLSMDQHVRLADGTEIHNHRDRDGNLLPTAKQVEDLGKALAADLSSSEAQQKLAKDLLSRFNYSDRPIKDQESFFKALNQSLQAAGVSVELKPGEKPTLVVNKKGAQPITIQL